MEAHASAPSSPTYSLHPLLTPWKAFSELLDLAQDNFQIDCHIEDEFQIKAFILPILPTVYLDTAGASMGPSSPWIHSSLVLDVLTLSQVSLRQMLHLSPRNSNKGPALVFVLLPVNTSHEETKSKQMCVRALPGSPCSVHTHPCACCWSPHFLITVCSVGSLKLPSGTGGPGEGSPQPQMRRGSSAAPGGEGWTQ